MPDGVVHEGTPCGSLQRRLSCERRFWMFGSMLLGFVAIAKGLRLPNTWAATQMALNYDFGFVKRGLVGATLTALGLSPAVYAHVVLVSLAAFALAMILLILLVRRAQASRLLARGAAVGVFFASFSLTCLAHLVGYADILLLALALAALLCGRMAVTALVAVIGTLAHESYVVVFLPLTMLPFLLEALGSDRVLRRLVPLSALVAGVACLVLYLAAGNPMEVARADELRAALAASADFPVRTDFFAVLEHSARDNVGVMRRHFHTLEWWRDEFLGAVSFLPTACFFWVLSLRAIARCQGPRGRAPARAGALAASLSPILMQVFGFDLYRWYALVALDSFLVALIISRHYLAPHRDVLELSAAGRNLTVLLIALNMATGVGLLDDRQVQTFPFADHLDALIDLLRRS